MYRLLRSFWRLAAVGGAIAVGILTRDAGFTAITFVGGLIVPPALGLSGPGRFGRLGRLGPGGLLGLRAQGPWGGACGAGGSRGQGRQGWDEWHRQLHQGLAAEGQPAATPPTAA